MLLASHTTAVGTRRGLGRGQEGMAWNGRGWASSAGAAGAGVGSGVDGLGNRLSAVAPWGPQPPLGNGGLDLVPHRGRREVRQGRGGRGGHRIGAGRGEVLGTAGLGRGAGIAGGVLGGLRPQRRGRGPQRRGLRAAASGTAAAASGTAAAASGDCGRSGGDCGRSGGRSGGDGGGSLAGRRPALGAGGGWIDVGGAGRSLDVAARRGGPIGEGIRRWTQLDGGGLDGHLVGIGRGRIGRRRISPADPMGALPWPGARGTSPRSPDRAAR